MGSRTRSEAAPLPLGPEGYVEADTVDTVVFRVRLPGDAYNRYERRANGDAYTGNGVTAPTLVVGGGGAAGPAGGVLSGTYPNPGFAVDMATQAELNAADALAVHLAGTETITGAKTLTSPLTFDSLLGAKPSFLAGDTKTILRVDHQAGTSGPWERVIEDSEFSGIRQPVAVDGLNIGPGRVAGRGGAGRWIEGHYNESGTLLMEMYEQFLSTTGTPFRWQMAEYDVSTSLVRNAIIAGGNVQFKSAFNELECNFARNNFTLHAPEPAAVNEFNLRANASNAAKFRIGNLGVDGVLDMFVDKDYGYATIQRTLLGGVPGLGDLRHLFDFNNVVAGGVTRFYGTAGTVFRTKATFGTDVLTTDVLATFAPPSVGHTADQAAFLVPGGSTVKGAVLAGGTWLSDDATKGIILKDAAGTPHYWRVTVSTTGVLTTTDLGTSRPTS